MKAHRGIRSVMEFLIVGFCTAMFALTAVGICVSVLGSDAAGTHDFAAYWASGKLLVHHANPYDRAVILEMERSVGFPAGFPPLVMRNPPYALVLAIPLGFLGPRMGSLVWFLISICCLLASVRMVWAMHGRPKNHLDLLGYSFVPVLACLLTGQMSLLILLGLVLFIRWHRHRPFAAGLALWLCMLKPHLFLPFGAVLLAWVIANRAYRIVGGLAVALAVSTGIVWILDPSAWAQYREMYRAETLGTMTPCLSILLRQSLSPGSVWLQFAPAMVACVLALGYFLMHKHHWDWSEHGSPLMLVAVLVAPYSWFYDQAILVPAILHGIYLTRSRNLLSVLALASAAVEMGSLGGLGLLYSKVFLWTAPAWLAWYLLATSSKFAKSNDGAAEFSDRGSSKVRLGGTIPSI